MVASSALADLPLPPGRRGLPLVGETVEWVRDPLRFAQERYARYGPVWRTHLLGQPCVVMLGAEANRFILSTHLHLFSSRQGWGRPITTLIGRGLSLIDGEEHRRHRCMIQPALHGALLQRYFATMQTLTHAHLRLWQQQAELRLFDAFKGLSFAIAARLMLGLEQPAAIAQVERDFYQFTAGLFALPAWRIPGTPYARAWRAGQRLRRALRRIIAARRQAAPQPDILSWLLTVEDEHGQRFSEAELLDELLVLLWAGHDTVTSMLTWAVLELARHPLIAARLQAELDAVLGRAPLQAPQLKRLPLLDAVLRETERLHPPAPGGFRGVVESFSYDGYRIPAGWTVMYSSVFTHHQPEIWSAPQCFDPDRFLPPRNEGRPFALVGFSAGPRVCVGLAFAQMQMRIVLAELLRTCRVELLPAQDLRPIPVPTAMPRDGLRVRIRPQL
ncbi:cytochrome P450 [Kallotenue papyrolyticum]|uniref:cytochrome P450 n=1 Tax=Kallotenue papyrolyticum TaxID=1325125 RepID=UPI00046FFD62|nr:cytochrome P450 [Kallotenue papyrolyticum]